METKIKQLKDLALLHDIALNWDAVPYPEEIEEVKEYLTEGIEREFEEEELENLLEEYSGWSVSDIESKVFTLIEEL